MKATFLILLLSLAHAAHAENWPRFRGPNGQGHSTEKNLPLHWSAESNVVWKVAIPGDSWSSPIVWNDRIFVTSATDGGTRCQVLCLDSKAGKVLWNKQALEQVPLRKEAKNSHATPTPCTDGERVFAVFGDGSVVALNFAGDVLWTNREVQYYSRHGLGASPIIHDGLVIMPYDHSNRNFTPTKGKAGDDERLGWQIPWDKSFLVALDAKTGKRVWTAKRGMSRVAHVTPFLLGQGAAAQLISGAGDCLQGFNPKTGERVWTIYSQGEGVTPSPVFGDGLIYASSGFEKTTVRAVRPDGQGDVTQTHIAWEERRGAPALPSLLYASPHLIAITEGGIVTCYQGKTGEIVYQERVGGNHCASPVLADGRIYFLSEAGETTVIATGPEFKILARNPLNEKCQASMAVSGGRLFIRTEKNLWCIGGK